MDYPEDDYEFAGLYGMHDMFALNQFLANSNKFFIFKSEFKGQHRIYVTDISTRKVKMLRIPNVTKSNIRCGNYRLMGVFEDTIIVNYSEPT